MFQQPVAPLTEAIWVVTVSPNTPSRLESACRFTTLRQIGEPRVRLVFANSASGKDRSRGARDSADQVLSSPVLREVIRQARSAVPEKAVTQILDHASAGNFLSLAWRIPPRQA